MLKIENERLRKGLPRFHNEEELEVIKIDKCIQDFDKLYLEHVKHDKGKEIEQPQPPPKKKRRKLVLNESDSDSSAPTPQEDNPGGSDVPLVSYEDFSDKGGFEEVAHLLRILKESGEDKVTSPL